MARTFAVSAGILEHKQRMGSAIWEFLWMIDHVTADELGKDGKFLGIVQFGQAISADTVARDLKESLDTAKVNLRKLCAAGYVSRRRVVGAGYSYTVINSKKWIWKRQNRHRVENPPMDAHRLENPSTENLPDARENPANDRRETPSNNKESKTLGRVGREQQSHHAYGAMKDWFAIKANIRSQLSGKEVPHWLRPMYLLKVMTGGVLLVALPPNTRIIAAARRHQDQLQRVVQEFGYSGIKFTRYPDEYERERLREEYPTFYEQMLGNDNKPQSHERRQTVTRSLDLPSRSRTVLDPLSLSDQDLGAGA